MAFAVLFALLCIGASASSDGGEEKLRCLGRYDELSKQTNNCGLKDPECPLKPPFQTVNITTDGEFRYVQTSYCPPYDWSCLRSPQQKRPCTKIQTFKVPLRPVVAKAPIQLGLGWPRGGLPRKPSGVVVQLRNIIGDMLGWPRGTVAHKDRANSEDLKTVTPMLGAIGVLVNGVALNGVASKLSETLEAGNELEGDDAWVDAGDAENWMDDSCAGHISGGGNYHTHVGAWHTPSKRLECGLPVDEANAHSQLLGWAFDGYAIYGPLEDGAAAASNLDACGGHTSKAQGGYHYHLSETYPYALECYHGCPAPSNNFRFKNFACEPKDGEEL